MIQTPFLARIWQSSVEAKGEVIPVDVVTLTVRVLVQDKARLLESARKINPEVVDRLGDLVKEVVLANGPEPLESGFEIETVTASESVDS